MRMATAADIQFHYDVHNDFYAMFLDRRFRTYSCAVWKSADSLEQAQEDKIDRMCGYAHIDAASHIIDVGCGWGGLMARAIHEHGAEYAHGLTLSRDQTAYITSQSNPNMTATLTSWRDFIPSGRKFDAVVSVGAFEHFASREQRLAGKHRDIYREFFHWCRDVSTVGAYLGLQTIVSARQPETLQEARDARYLLDKVFPGSALPSVSDVQGAALDLYEVAALKRIGADYARTLSCWKSRLLDQREIAIERFGRDIFEHYVRYFEAAERSFATGVTDLLQVSFKRVAESRSDQRGAVA